MSTNLKNGSRLESDASSLEIKAYETINSLANPSRRKFNKLLGNSFLAGAVSASPAALIGCTDREEDKKLTSGNTDSDKKKVNPPPEFSEAELKELIEKTAIRSITPINSPVAIDLARAGNENNVKQRMMELQKEWKELSLNALRRFEEADPRVSDLLQFMEKHAVYPIANGLEADNGPGTDDPFAFEIVFVPGKYAKKYSHPVMTNGNHMFISTIFKSEEWFGIILAHELSHIRDFVLHNENTKNQSEYLRGEVNAHLFEMELLKYWNPDTYNTLIKAGAPLTYGELSRAKFVPLIDSLYPLNENIVSHDERGLGGSSCLMAIWLEEGKRRGLSEKEMENAYGFVASKL